MNIDDAREIVKDSKGDIRPTERAIFCEGWIEAHEAQEERIRGLISFVEYCLRQDETAWHEDTVGKYQMIVKDPLENIYAKAKDTLEKFGGKGE